MPVTLQKLKIVHNQRLATLTEFLAFSAKLRPFQQNSEFRRRSRDFPLKKTFFQILSVFQTHLNNLRKSLYANDF